MQLMPSAKNLKKITIVLSIIFLLFLLKTINYSPKSKNIDLLEADISSVIPYNVKASSNPPRHPSRIFMEYAFEIARQQKMTPFQAANFYAYIATIYEEILKLTDSSQLASLSLASILNDLLPKYKLQTQEILNQLNIDNKILQKPTLGQLNSYKERIKNDCIIKNTNECQNWVLENYDIKIPPPPKDTSLLKKLEIAKVKYQIYHRAFEDFDSIIYWYRLGSFFKNDREDYLTPAGIWQNILYHFSKESINDQKYALIQKILAQTLADTYREIYKTRQKYISTAPFENIPDFEKIVEPSPHSAYISELTAISSSAQTVLSNLIPQKKEAFVKLAKDAQKTDLISGVNFASDSEIGILLGQTVAENILKKQKRNSDINNPSKIELSSSKNFFEIIPQLIYFEFQPKIDSFAQNIKNSISFYLGNKPSFDEAILQTHLYHIELATGTSWVDYNHDNYPDLFLAAIDKTILYKNNGDGTFTNVSKQSGLTTALSPRGGVFGDYDNDGCPDLYVTKRGKDQLYHNNCDGTFSDVTDEAKIGDFGEGTGASWADYDNDGYLDLYVANFGQSYTPGEMTFEKNLLLRNNGNGTFSDYESKAKISGVADCKSVNIKSPKKIPKAVGGPLKQSFQALWFDYNNDGKSDLFVANDIGFSPLYENNGDGTFTDVTQKANLCKFASFMGIAVGDYNNDGFLDLYATDAGSNTLWQNKRDGTFTDISEPSQVANIGSLGWGASFFDFNNDGNLDIYAVNGTLRAYGYFNKYTRRNDRLYQGDGKGNFIDVAEKEGIFGNDPKLNAALADFNNDGFVDIYTTHAGITQNSTLYHDRFYKNRGNKNNWLAVRLQGVKSNRDAIGARITIRLDNKIQTREIYSASSFLSQNSLTQYFGLGRNNKIEEIEIKWPTGIKDKLQNVSANQSLTIKEGETISER